jgi:UDP-3-O-[3-hydroxymyristoyl] glucosamine N-acyltransferase
MRVSEIAGRMNAKFEGDGDLEITSAAPLESAGPREIAFVQSRKAAAHADKSGAGCLLVTADFPPGRTVIRVNNPRASLAATIQLLFPPAPVMAGIHPTAIIGSDAVIASTAAIGPYVTIGERARIGERTAVGAGSTIGASVDIGDDCLLHPRVTIYEQVKIGHRAVLHSGCVLGADGFGFERGPDGGYQKFPQIGRVEIGDDVEIGANSCVDRAALGVTRIGDGVKLDNLVHIAHNCVIGNHVVIAAQTGLAGGVVVEEYAVIGGQVGIGDKVRIESGVILGSGCGVLSNAIVRQGQVYWGTPARPVKEYLKQLASLTRLPKMRDQIAAIEKRLESPDGGSA